MKNKIKHLAFGILLTMGFSGIAGAQDAQISQYSMAPVLYNPGNTGMMKYSDFRIAALYRNQWSSLANTFNTFALSFDMHTRGRWGFGGAVVNSDQADIISTLNVLGSVAYQVSDPNHPKYMLSVGVQAGFLYKTLNTKDLIFDNQYDGQNFDRDLPTGESFQKNSRFMPDVNFGISYKSTNRATRFNPYADAAVFHISSPDEAFIGEEKSKLPMRWVGGVGAKWEVKPGIVLDPSVIYMRQRQANQFLGTVMGAYEIRGTQYQVLGGLGYRSNDAAIVHAGIRHDSNIFRVSYDVNISGLSEYSNNRGALEFTVIYSPGRRTSRAIY